MRRTPADYARYIMSRHPVFLDTETTGLAEHDEIVNIAIIDHTGRVLLDTLVKPTIAISSGATQIHGIDNERVADAPTFATIKQRVVELTTEKDVVIYNAKFDCRMIHQSGGTLPVDSSRLHCAMLLYAEFFGQWNGYRKSYRWQTLDDAMRQQELPGVETPLHSAIGDCLRTLAIVQHMARG